MSGEPKTLTLTPEQQAKLNHLVEREMDEAYYTGLYMKAKDARACLREFAVEVLEELGVPVVARDEAAELRAALRTLVHDLEALMEESHLQLYDGDGALVGTSWGKVLQGGKDEYLSNWNEAKRLTGGESGNG